LTVFSIQKICGTVPQRCPEQLHPPIEAAALRRGAPAHHVWHASCVSSWRNGATRLQEIPALSERKSTHPPLPCAGRLASRRFARPHEADRVLASALSVACGWRIASQAAIGVWKRPHPPTGTEVCPKRKEPVRVDEAAMSSSARTHQANGSSTFTPAFLKSRVFRVTTMKP
jgi:hypothetical protein